jgi:hypothetical protein
MVQTRNSPGTAVLNGELRDHFEKWYPAMRVGANDAESNIPVNMAA